MHRSFVPLIVCALSALASLASAQGSTASVSTNTLPTIVVTGVRLPDETVPLDKFPASVSVVTSQDIAASPGVSILDILRQQPGIYYSDTVGLSQSGTKLNMRGYSDKPGTLILLNGVRVSDAGDGTFLWNSIPLSDIDRVEIIRGGASTTYGEGAIGGVVNIVTKSPSPE